MPYISIEKQKPFQLLEAELNSVSIRDSGELNYVLTLAAVGYLKQHGLRYQTMNDIVGALEGAKLEFQRRIVGPYEAQKAFDVGMNLDGWGNTGDPYNRDGGGQDGN
jgi:hypothetical protein